MKKDKPHATYNKIQLFTVDVNRAREARQRLRTVEDWTGIDEHQEIACTLSTLTGETIETFKSTALLKLRATYDEKQGLIFALVCSDYFALLYKFPPG
jgi:hypothetical protein